MQKLRENLRWYLLAALFVTTIFIWYAVVRENRNGILKIAFLDIGQGDAIFVEAPNGNQLLIDGGPPKAVLSALRRVMPFYDRSIDMLLVTNPDRDHMAGFIDVLTGYHVGSIVEPGTVGASAEYREFEKVIGDRNPSSASEGGAPPLKKGELPKRILARRGQTIWLDKKRGIGFHILFPDRDVSGVATNDGSIVGRLVYGDTSIMFTGDAPQDIEHYLVSLDGKNLKSDVLKVGHHGSRTSTSAEFVGVVAPAYAAISDGRGNKYGHPHKETLDTLAQFGVHVYRTDEFGTIVTQSDGENVSVSD